MLEIVYWYIRWYYKISIMIHQNPAESGVMFLGVWLRLKKSNQVGEVVSFRRVL